MHIRVPLAACLLGVLALSSCAERETPATPDAQADADATIPLDRYEVRGEVVMLPNPEQPLADFQVRHEHIPGFIGWDGVIPVDSNGITGMKSMTMPFPVESDGTLEGVEIGQKVMLRFAVDRNAKRYWAESVEALPADTELDYTNRAPDGP